MLKLKEEDWVEKTMRYDRC